MSSSPKVLLFGAGSIGIVYLYIFQQAGCKVTAVCRSNYDIAKTSGFRISSGIFGPDIHLHPDVFRTVDEAVAASGPFDFVVVTTKAFPSAVPLKPPSPAAAALSAAISPTTTIVLIQNGIQIEDEYSAAYPTNPLLSCVLYLPSKQVSPAVVSMGKVAHLQIGPFPAIPSPPSDDAAALETLAASHPPLARALQLRDLAVAGGGTSKVYADVQPRRWRKLLLNCGWNPVCALSRSVDVDVLRSCDEGTDYVRKVMLEVVSVATAVGYAEVGPRAVEEQLAIVGARVPAREGIEPSMLADVLAGRRMEVEAILGGVVRTAAKVGVDVPRLQGLYVLCRALDDRIREAVDGVHSGM